MSHVQLAISAGDPQGVGPLVALLASRAALDADPELTICLFGPGNVLTDLCARHGIDFSHQAMTICALSDFECQGAAPTAQGGASALMALDAALELIDADCHGLVTAPLSKEAVAHASPGFTGHTEYLAHRAKVPVLMMLANDKLRVALATTHMALRSVGAALDPKLMRQQLLLLVRELKARFGAPQPKVAVLAVNPHAGEGGLLGAEEDHILIPLLGDLGGAEAGFFGPFSADTFFLPGRYERFDAIFAMYHDQGLIPVKMLGPKSTVNVTLGLPYVRTSPDHGTAFDLAADVQPDWQSMFCAVSEAARQVRALAF